jgi:hypothetical protein
MASDWTTDDIPDNSADGGRAMNRAVVLDGGGPLGIARQTA